MPSPTSSSPFGVKFLSISSTLLRMPVHWRILMLVICLFLGASVALDGIDSKNANHQGNQRHHRADARKPAQT